MNQYTVNVSCDGEKYKIFMKDWKYINKGDIIIHKNFQGIVSSKLIIVNDDGNSSCNLILVKNISRLV